MIKSNLTAGTDVVCRLGNAVFHSPRLPPSSRGSGKKVLFKFILKGKQSDRTSTPRVNSLTTEESQHPVQAFRSFSIRPLFIVID